MDRLRTRVADRRVVGLVGKFLKAGVLAEDQFLRTDNGTPQGGIMAPRTQKVTLRSRQCSVRTAGRRAVARCHGQRDAVPDDDLVVADEDSGSLRTPCPPNALASGQRGITPVFGYGAPHSSTEGTSTLLIHALPSAQYGLAEHARRTIAARSNSWVIFRVGQRELKYCAARFV
jgi:hypothetical protein